MLHINVIYSTIKRSNKIPTNLPYPKLSLLDSLQTNTSPTIHSSIFLSVLLGTLPSENSTSLSIFVPSLSLSRDPSQSPSNKPSIMPSVVPSFDPSGDPSYVSSYVTSVNPYRAQSEQQVGAIEE